MQNLTSTETLNISTCSSEIFTQSESVEQDKKDQEMQSTDEVVSSTPSDSNLAVDKLTRNNQALSLSFYHHLLFYRNLCFDRTDLWFRSNSLDTD